MSRATRSRRGVSEGGFTLVELMIVVVIIGILAAFSVPTLQRSMRRSAARESASAMAQVFRTARTQAMSRGEVVLLELNPAGTVDFAKMSAAPNTVVGDDSTPPMRSCRLLTDFDAAMAAPHKDSDGNAIPAFQFDVSDVLDPNMVVFATGGTQSLKLCFAPDGRVYDGDKALPVDLGPGACATGPRGFVVAVGRSGGGTDARALPNTLGGAAIDGVCDRSVEASVTRDTQYLYVIEVNYNGAIRIEH